MDMIINANNDIKIIYLINEDDDTMNDVVVMDNNFSHDCDSIIVVLY